MSDPCDRILGIKINYFDVLKKGIQNEFTKN